MKTNPTRTIACGLALIAASALATYGDQASFVLSQAPIGYWNFENGSQGNIPNLGILGAQAEGSFLGGAGPYAAGPLYAGFPATNHAVELDGVARAVRIPPLNLSLDGVSMTAWIRPDGAQVGAAGLVLTRGIGVPSGLMIDRGGGFDLAYNWNDTSSSYNWISYLSAPDTNWSFVGLAVAPGEAAIYLGDPVTRTFYAATNYMLHAPQSFTDPTYIGSDGTSNYFRGTVDDVAIFSRTLTAGEVYSQFASALGELPARIFVHPNSPAGSLFSGDALTLRVDAGGTPPISYAWRKSGVPIPGATNSSLVRPTITMEDNGTYDVEVTAGVGSPVVSQPAVVTVAPVENPTVLRGPEGRTLYPGGTLTLSVAASGGGLSYRWLRNGVAIQQATNALFRVSAVTPQDAGMYEVVVTNNVGQTTAGPAFVAVMQPSAGSYEAAMVEHAPQAWWRLDETNGALVMLDVMGRHDGVYSGEPGSSVLLGTAGIAGSTAAAFNGSPSYGVVPFSTELNPVEFTLVAWVRSTDLALAEMTPVSSRYEGKGVWFWLYPAGRWSGGASGSGFNYYIPSSAPEGRAGSNEWTMLAISYSPESTLRFLVNGQWDGTGYADFERNSGGPLLIGARGATASTMAEGFFHGDVDEVALYKRVLTQEQLRRLYILAIYGTNSPPVIRESPESTNVQLGATVVFRARVEGSDPVALQWFKDGVPVPKANEKELEVGNVRFLDAGSYTLVATNPAGKVVSSPALLTVAPPRSFANATNALVLHLAFDGDYLDQSGHSNHGIPVGGPAFVSGRIGTQALRYSTQTGLNDFRYVLLGRPTDLMLGSNRSFSVSYWIRTPTNAMQGDLPVLANSLNSLGSQGVTIGPSYQAGSWAWSLSDGATGLDAQGSVGAINNGVWHHLIHCFDRSAHTAVTYLDGRAVNTQSIAGVGSVETEGNFTVGQTSGGDYSQDGVFDLDDLGVWRRALSGDEVQAIYSAGVHYGNSFDTLGPVKLEILRSGARVLLVWEAGVLLEADAVSGPWGPVNGAHAPNHWLPLDAKMKFYKVQP